MQPMLYISEDTQKLWDNAADYRHCHDLNWIQTFSYFSEFNKNGLHTKTRNIFSPHVRDSTLTDSSFRCLRFWKKQW